MSESDAPRVWAMLPTYNESGNIESLIRALLETRDDLGVVVVDDNSPDGTWKIVQSLAAEFPGRVDLLLRTRERGRGSAGVAGFKRALELGAAFVIEMDADWSHHPRHVPELLAAAMGEGDGGSGGAATCDSGNAMADVVIGSRLVPGGGEAGRPFIRTLITHAANLYIRLMLGLRVRDCTTGYRVFSRRMLEGIAWERMESNGPAIVQEMLLACRALGGRMVEVPIRFEQRRAGQSTFNTKIMLAGLGAVLKFRFRKPPVKDMGKRR